MVPKQVRDRRGGVTSFRAVLFRMVPKLKESAKYKAKSFRAVLFRMVPKRVPY